MYQFEKLSALSLAIICSIVVFDCKFPVLGVSTIFTLLYIIVVFFASVWTCFLCVQNFLSSTTPFKPNSSLLLRLVHRQLPPLNINLQSSVPLDLEERVDHFVEDIERICIRRWYTNYISTDEEFLQESRNLLKSIILRFVHIATRINTDKVLHGTLTIFLRHIKEFRRASKKSQTLRKQHRPQEANDGWSIEELYRYAHPASAGLQNFETFALQITSMTLKHFVHWEVYNSLACRTLISILSRKVFSSVVQLVSSPGYINYKVLMVVDPREEYKQYQNVSIGDVDHSKPNLVDKVRDEGAEEVVNPERVPDGGSENMKDEEEGDVKIYEPRKTTNTTWRNSSDLDCISLGQDMLFLSNITEEDDSKTPDWYQLAEEFKTASNLMKKTIGEATAVTVKDTVVEGILDLGIAGLRKGLRLTGLQEQGDDPSKRPKTDSKDIPQGVHPNVRLPKCEQNSSDTEVFINPLMTSEASPEDLQCEEPNSPIYEGDILLERSPTSEETSCAGGIPRRPLVPNLEFFHVEDSPDPEYEDNNDLATTTAKLRSLLAQKTETNSPLASPMSFIATPADASGSSVDEVSEVDGALPSMYKAWAKTATGVFHNTLNTIKTALPGSGQEEDNAAPGIVPTPSSESGQGPLTQNNPLQVYTDDDWDFVPISNEPSQNFIKVLDRFLVERQQFCTVDSAFEAIEGGDQFEDEFGALPINNNHKYEEDLDDFETTIPMTKALIDVISELIEDTYPTLVKANVIKSFLLTFGVIAEEKLHNMGAQIIPIIIHQIGHLPSDLFDSKSIAMAMNMDELVNPLLNSIKSDILGQWLDDASMTSVLRLLLTSAQNMKINVDTCLQVFELFAAELIVSR